MIWSAGRPTCGLLLASWLYTEACLIEVLEELRPTTPPSEIGRAVGCHVWVVDPIRRNQHGVNLARDYLGDEDKTVRLFLCDHYG